MKKYLELVEKYRDEIDEIKEQVAKVERLRAEAASIDPFEGGEFSEAYGPQPDYDKVRDQEADYSAAEAESHFLDLLWEKLDEDIRHEYWDVPFEEPRQAGIRGFYRESGLADLA